MVGDAEPGVSASVAARIARRASRQRARPGGRLNSRVSGRALRAIAALGPVTARRLADLADAELLSGRGTERLLRVARTVADLAGSPRSRSSTSRRPRAGAAVELRAPMALAV